VIELRAADEPPAGTDREEQLGRCRIERDDARWWLRQSERITEVVDDRVR
jgi:hypothetical protein